MTLAITQESRNSLSITNESKLANPTWDEMVITWDEAAGTWDEPGIPLTQDTKNNLTITNEASN